MQLDQEGIGNIRLVMVLCQCFRLSQMLFTLLQSMLYCFSSAEIVYPTLATVQQDGFIFHKVEPSHLPVYPLASYTPSYND